MAVAFAADAVVAVRLGVFGRVHDPTLSGTTDLAHRVSGAFALLHVVADLGGLVPRRRGRPSHGGH